MTLKSHLVKWALISCYKYRGVDYKREVWDDSNANYIETENYSIRQQRYDLPDFVITKSGILIYSYCPDPREHPYTSTQLMTLREFLKERQYQQIRRVGNKGSQAKMKEVMKEYLTREKLEIDWEKYHSADNENELWIKQSIAHIDKYIDSSFRIRLASWIVGL